MSAVPARSSMVQKAVTVDCRVSDVRRHGTFAVVSLVAPHLARRAVAGQFVMVAVPRGGFVLRRPLSVHAVRGDSIALLIEARGHGSAALAAVDVGQTLSLAGPLGTGFVTEGVQSALLVGGGIGVAPFQMLAERLAAAGSYVTAAFGFRDHRQARVAGAFDIPQLWVATEDGSLGRRGTAVELAETLAVQPGTVVYACGPLPMIGAVQRWAQSHELTGQASLEAHMACGSGSCHGCVIETTAGYLRVCSEGPVFDLRMVIAP